MSGSVPHLRTSAYLCLGSGVTSPLAPCGWVLRYVGGPLGLIASFSFTLDCCLSELFVWQKYFEHISHNPGCLSCGVMMALRGHWVLFWFFPLSSFSWSRWSLCGKLWVQCLAHSTCAVLPCSRLHLFTLINILLHPHCLLLLRCAVNGEAVAESQTCRLSLDYRACCAVCTNVIKLGITHSVWRAPFLLLSVMAGWGIFESFYCLTAVL